MLVNLGTPGESSNEWWFVRAQDNAIVDTRGTRPGANETFQLCNRDGNIWESTNTPLVSQSVITLRKIHPNLDWNNPTDYTPGAFLSFEGGGSTNIVLRTEIEDSPVCPQLFRIFKQPPVITDRGITDREIRDGDPVCLRSERLRLHAWLNADPSLHNLYADFGGINPYVFTFWHTREVTHCAFIQNLDEEPTMRHVHHDFMYSNNPLLEVKLKAGIDTNPLWGGNEIQLLREGFLDELIQVVRQENIQYMDPPSRSPDVLLIPNRNDRNPRNVQPVHVFHPQTMVTYRFTTFHIPPFQCDHGLTIRSFSIRAMDPVTGRKLPVCHLTVRILPKGTFIKVTQEPRIISIPRGRFSPLEYAVDEPHQRFSRALEYAVEVQYPGPEFEIIMVTTLMYPDLSEELELPCESRSLSTSLIFSQNKRKQ